MFQESKDTYFEKSLLRELLFKSQGHSVSALWVKTKARDKMVTNHKIAMDKLKTHLQNLKILKANDILMVKRLDWNSPPSLIINGKCILNCEYCSRNKEFKVNTRHLKRSLGLNKPNKRSFNRKQNNKRSFKAKSEFTIGDMLKIKGIKLSLEQ